MTTKTASSISDWGTTIEVVEFGPIRVEATRYPLFDGEATECFRIEVKVDGAANGEVAYWYTDGTNDIMHGEKGSMIEATNALIDFATKGW